MAEEVSEGPLQTEEEFIRDLVLTESLDSTKIIFILQQVQQKFGYISREAISAITAQLPLPAVDIFGIATFYEQFRFNKPGKHLVKVCEGTACHVKDGAAITQTIERELKISPGETSDDGLFSLERVACLGCCALAPVVVVDDDIHGMMSTSALSSLLNKYKEDTDTSDTTDTTDTDNIEGSDDALGGD